MYFQCQNRSDLTSLESAVTHSERDSAAPFFHFPLRYNWAIRTLIFLIVVVELCVKSRLYEGGISVPRSKREFLHVYAVNIVRRGGGRQDAVWPWES